MLRLLIALASLLLGWLGAAQALAAAAAAPPAAHVYNYDDHHSSAPWTSATTERGPPATNNDATIHDADGPWSLGASARPNAAATPAIYDYGVLAAFEQTSRGSSRGVQGQVGSIQADLAGVERSDVAANGARVFASTDAHVASAANSIEADLPGRVVGVNTQRAMSNGLTREVDIDLGDLLVQVKSGSARGLTGQIARTQASTGTRTIGYAPDISDAAWRNAAQRGIPILRSPSELLAYVREFG